MTKRSTSLYIGGIIVLTMISCKTYTIPVESFKIMMAKARFEKKEDTVASSLDSLKHYNNDVAYLFAINKNDNKEFIKPTPDLQIRIRQLNGERDIFYFNLVFIVNDTLEGGKSKFLRNLRKKIPVDAIDKIEIRYKNPLTKTTF